MRKVTFFAPAIGLMLLMSCGEKKAEPAQPATNEPRQTEAKAAEGDGLTAIDEQSTSSPQVTPASEQQTTPSGRLGDLQPTLARQAIKMPQNAEKPKARDFARAFCQRYSDFGACALLLKYLQSPNAFDAKAENAKVVDDRPNGYVRCDKMALFDMQDDETIEACRWMRSNGHSLVGVFMHSANDAGVNHYAYAFYDYDPATNVMTPDEAALDAVATAQRRFGGNDLVLHLPQKGKDLTLEFLTLEAGDVTDAVKTTLHWTGDKFQ